MRYLEEEELKQIEGGFQLNGVMIQYGIKAFQFIYDMGRALGSSIRRIGAGNYCSIN